MSKKQQGEKRNGAGQLLAMLPFLLAGGVVGGMAAGMLLNADPDMSFGAYMLQVMLLMLGVLVGSYVQIIIHEGGHLVFGCFTGYRFVSFNVAGFVWQKGPDGKICTGRIQIAGAGGQCLMAPPEYNGGKFPFVLYNLGGVLANVISAAVFAVLAQLVRGIPLAYLLLMAMAVMGIAFAITNGLPLPVAAIQNDASNILCIRRDETARWAFWVQMSVAAALADGKRLRDMPQEWFAPLPDEKMDNPIVCAVAVFAANRHMDRLDFDAAERDIRALLARKKGVLDLYRMTLCCDGAVCELIAGRPEELTAQLDTKQNQQLMKAMKTQPSLIRTRYALSLLRDKDEQAARKQLEAFEKTAKTHPFAQEVVSEREVLLAIGNAKQNGGITA